MANGKQALIGVAAGAGGAQVGTLAAKYLLPLEHKKYASAVGLGVGLLAAGGLAVSRKTRGAAVLAAVAALLTSGPRVAEALFLPKPEGGHDLGVVTVDELRAVVVRERGLRGANVQPALAAAFGNTPLAMSR